MSYNYFLHYPPNSKSLSNLTKLSTQYDMHVNHELIQKAMLPRKINIISYQGNYKENGAKIKVALNVTITIKLGGGHV